MRHSRYFNKNLFHAKEHILRGRALRIHKLRERSRTRSEDIIRVFRVLEYSGRRSRVEDTIARSIHNDRIVGNGLTIRAATLGTYPEILEKEDI